MVENSQNIENLTGESESLTEIVHQISRQIKKGKGSIIIRVDWNVIVRGIYRYRTDNKKPLVTYRFLNLSSFLDLSPGVSF